MALYTSSATPIVCNGRVIRAVRIMDDKAPADARAVCSLVPRLNGGKIPTLSELPGIIRGDSIAFQGRAVPRPLFA